MTPSAHSAPAVWDEQDLRERERWYERWAREALEPTPELSLAEWAEDHIEIPEGEPIPGRLDLRYSPYMRGILDLFSNPDVSEVTVVKSTQVGWTLMIVVLALYTNTYRRARVLLVQPTDPAARRFNITRLQPVLDASAKLAHLSPKGRGRSAKQVDYTNGAMTRFAGAGSPTDLGEISVPVVINDEFEKYPRHSGPEGDPIKLGAERMRWWRDKLHVKGTTPSVESGYSFREMNSAPCQMRYYVKCPYCRTAQALYWDGEAEIITREVKGEEIHVKVTGPAGRINWPKDERGHALHTPEEIDAQGLAWYECGKCERHWSEQQKDRIIERGEWRVISGGRPHGHVGVHLWAVLSSQLTFSRIAREWLTSEGRAELEQNFMNSWLGRNYRQKGDRPTYEFMVSRKKIGRLCGQVPEGVRFLTAGIDVHKALQYWMVWGWGAGFTGWLIDAGREDVAASGEEAWQRVYRACTRDYPVVTADGALGSLAVGEGAGIALMDSGWYKRQDNDPDENVNEAEVIERCASWNDAHGTRIFHPSKGGSVRAQFPPLKFSGKTYDVTRTGYKLKHRLELHVFNPWFFKKDFYARLARPGEVGGLWLPADLREIYMRQMMAEERVTKPDGTEDFEKRGENHGLDCAVMCLAAAWRFRLYLDAGRPAAGGGGKSTRLSDIQRARERR